MIHFSIQQDHGHFIVEGDEARRARGGVHGLAIRLALAVNRVLGRKGKVVGDRYHARPLTTPRQMRTSMVYVLLNFRKHLRAPACIDPRSSGPHFSGWQAIPAATATNVAPATVPPDTWMARVGWRLAGGPLRVDEQPAAVRRRPSLNRRMSRWVGAPKGTSHLGRGGFHPQDVTNGEAWRGGPPAGEGRRRNGRGAPHPFLSPLRGARTNSYSSSAFAGETGS